MRKFEIVKDKMRKYPEANIKMPNRATKNSAGYDLYSPIETTIAPNETKLIFTDIKAKFGKNEVLLVMVTSGMGKRGLIAANGVGVIDSDYYNNENNDGNIGIMLHNFSSNEYQIKAGDKIGQCIFTNFLTTDNECAISTKRIGGFGSTVKK